MKKKKYGNISKKELIFFAVQIFILLLSCWPGLFWGNIAKTVLGIPYFLVYVFALTVISDVVLIIQYFVDVKDGEVDFEVDPDHDYLQNLDLLKQDD